MSNEKRIYFPPYGVLNQNEAPNVLHQLPIDWLPAPQDKGVTIYDKYIYWLNGVVEQINEVLWPTWDVEKSQWKPSRSVDHMEALTRADFAIFEQMDRERVNRGLDRMLDSPNRAENSFSHRELFLIDDSQPPDEGASTMPILSYYAMYDSKLSETLAKEVMPQWFNALHHKVHSTHYLVKLKLERPRACQTAMMLGYPDFINELAQTGLTPSSCSGHCLQGLAGMGGVFEYFHSSGVKMDADNRGSMGQAAVDIGDRRVMAGVHYPSDNICSWIILMNIADRVYRDPAVKLWLWEAITERSWVYKSIVKYDSQTRNSALRPALDHLHKLAPK